MAEVKTDKLEKEKEKKEYKPKKYKYGFVGKHLEYGLFRFGFFAPKSNVVESICRLLALKFKPILQKAILSLDKKAVTVLVRHMQYALGQFTKLPQKDNYSGYSYLNDKIYIRKPKPSSSSSSAASAPAIADEEDEDYNPLMEVLENSLLNPVSSSDDKPIVVADDEKEIELTNETMFFSSSSSSSSTASAAAAPLQPKPKREEKLKEFQKKLKLEKEGRSGGTFKCLLSEEGVGKFVHSILFELETENKKEFDSVEHLPGVLYTPRYCFIVSETGKPDFIFKMSEKAKRFLNLTLRKEFDSMIEGAKNLYEHRFNRHVQNKEDSLWTTEKRAVHWGGLKLTIDDVLVAVKVSDKDLHDAFMNSEIELDETRAAELGLIVTEDDNPNRHHTKRKLLDNKTLLAVDKILYPPSSIEQQPNKKKQKTTTATATIGPLTVPSSMFKSPLMIKCTGGCNSNCDIKFICDTCNLCRLGCCKCAASSSSSSSVSEESVDVMG